MNHGNSGVGRQTSFTSDSKLGTIKPLDTFIVNLSGASGRNYLKVEIGLELSDDGLAEEVENKMPKIRDAILLILSTRTFDDIKTGEGKLALKEMIMKRINSFLNTGTVRNVYFTSFVIQ